MPQRLQLKPIAFLTILVACAGCTTNICYRPNTQVPLAELQRRPPLLVFAIPAKEITYTEMLYRVFWNETRADSLSYDGIWDPAPLFKQGWIKSMKNRHGLPLVELDGLVDSNHVQAVVRRLEQAISQDISGFLKGPVDEAMLSEYRRLGSDFVFELYAGPIAVASNPLRGLLMQISAAGRLIRTADGAIIWHNCDFAGRFIGAKEFAELEKDDLALIKSNFVILLDELMESTKTSFMRDNRPRLSVGVGGPEKKGSR